jgi:phospholipid/cholesterol/gamma-HCH transport system substrate-binding protein
MRRRDEVLVGMFTLVAIIIAVLGSIWLIRGGLGKGYSLYSRFPWGAGLKQGQPVWLAGVAVGFVDVVELDPNGTVVVTYQIEKEYNVPTSTTAQVVPNGFFGDQAIALTPKTSTTTYFQPGDTVPAGPPAVSLLQIESRVDTIAMVTNELLRAIKLQLADSGGVAELRRTFVATSRLAAQLTEVAAVQSKELQATMASLRRSVNAVDSARVDSTLRSLSAASANAADVSAQLKGTAERFNAILTQVQSGNGTASKILSDPALYDDVRGAVARLDSLLADLKRNPRKYIDLRIF